MDDLFNFWIKEFQHEQSGWDISTIKDRMVMAPLDWSYHTEVLYPLRNVDSVLDMHTGSGEFLSILQPFPTKTVATEGYQENIEIARKQLEPLGVNVIATDSDILPFEDDSFELVINRQGSFDSSEIERVLEPGGFFITQQVGSKDQKELNQLLLQDQDELKSWTKRVAVRNLDEASFDIIRAIENFPETRFYDIGALIYYFSKVTWQIPDFSVESYRRQLGSIHNIITQKGWIASKAHRFLIVAKTSD